MKSVVLATALLLPASIAFGQDEAAPKPLAPPKPPVARVVKPVAKPVEAAAGPVEVTQIVAIRQIDPTTYEIDAKSQSGSMVILRMNAFVMQDLGRQLGTYGKR